MGPVQIITTVAFLLIALITATMLYIKYKAKANQSGSEEDKQKATDFLNGLQDAVLGKIAEVLKTFDYSAYDNFADLEFALITQVTDVCTEYVEKELSQQSTLLSAMVIQLLHSGMIEEFVRQCVERMQVDKAAEAELAEKIAEYQEIAVEMEASYVAEYADPNKYIDNPDDIVYEDPVDEVPSEEELSKLNPQRDEEESYNPEDDSMEIVEETTEDLDLGTADDIDGDEE